MSIEFSVGCPEDVFRRQIAEAVRDILELRFGIKLPEQAYAYHSEQLSYDGLEQLVALSIENLGPSSCTHISAMRYFFGAYLPVALEPTPVSIPGDNRKLICAGLSGLLNELSVLANKCDLPWEDGQIEHYLNQNEYPDKDDASVETFCFLLLALRIAIAHNLPVWLV
jgi:hypothetical protein